MIKPGLNMLVKVKRYLPSFMVMWLSDAMSFTVFAPIGKPQRRPRTRGYVPYGESFRIFPAIGYMCFVIIGIAPILLIISVININGKSVGNIVKSHNLRPDKAPSFATDGIIKKINSINRDIFIFDIKKPKLYSKHYIKGLFI